jgi:hypothetical protein
MKKVIWFLKKDGKEHEMKIADIIALTSIYKGLKITEYDTDEATHKVVEFLGENIINA